MIFCPEFTDDGWLAEATCTSVPWVVIPSRYPFEFSRNCDREFAVSSEVEYESESESESESVSSSSSISHFPSNPITRFFHQSQRILKKNLDQNHHMSKERLELGRNSVLRQRQKNSQTSNAIRIRQKLKSID